MWQGAPKKHVIIVTFLFLFVITLGLGDFRAQQLAVDLVAERAANAVRLLGAELEPAEIARLTREADERDPYFLALRERMGAILAEHELRGLYITAKNEDSYWYYVADGRGPENPQYFPSGTVDENIDDAMTERAVRGLEARRYAAGWSSARVSVYEGIQSAGGEYIAVVGADYDAVGMTRFLYMTKYSQIFVAGVGLLLLALYKSAAERLDESGRRPGRGADR
ncbi:MAG: hypothetical protein LBS10_05060 [Gracilibacteraceae bacterium]|jgi:hypothetical protein|nr:hypothetical protein [Gracilibacteraceae bacterium]